ncbi:hypothetical protein, partial [Pseudomonas viridiflava]|uniref:hypothetical protein n=1 Tax=Pseudomonas viridiflava TaxID=33069 RepID=UPI00197D4A40
MGGCRRCSSRIRSVVLNGHRLRPDHRDSRCPACRQQHYQKQDDSEQRQAYADDVRRHVNEYQNLKRSYYSVETRYSDQPFWARRQTATAA